MTLLRFLLPAALLFLAGCSVLPDILRAAAGERARMTETGSPSAQPAPEADVMGHTLSDDFGFTSTIEAVDEATAARMAHSWRPGCPVGLGDLRLVRVAHRDFERGTSVGELIVHHAVATDVVRVFKHLYVMGYPIERMVLVDEYGGDDDRSMAANNTSAFNCRTVAGSSSWSEHAFGKAIDVNPLVNPYVRGTYVQPSGGVEFLNRQDDHPAMIQADDEVVQAFRAIGWVWGGTWRSAKDYQHFSASGR